MLGGVHNEKGRCGWEVTVAMHLKEAGSEDVKWLRIVT
jgi:hypothetical protein